MLRNAFDLLADGGGQPAAVASKSKKKSKKKGGGAAIGEAIVENQPLSTPAPDTQPVQSAKDAGEALEAAAVAAGPGELGSLAADWAEQVRAHTASELCQQPPDSAHPLGHSPKSPACRATCSWCAVMKCSQTARTLWSSGRQVCWVPGAMPWPRAATDRRLHGPPASPLSCCNVAVHDAEAPDMPPF